MENSVSRKSKILGISIILFGLIVFVACGLEFDYIRAHFSRDFKVGCFIFSFMVFLFCLIIGGFMAFVPPDNVPKKK